MFGKIRDLYDAGSTVREIAQKLGLGPRRVDRWVRCIDMPERSAMEPKPSTPAYFGAFLARSWAEGTTKVRHLFSDIRHRGYTGSYSHLACFVAPWRNNGPSENEGDWAAVDQEAPAPLPMRVLDPMTGRRISPLVAAALCIKPRRQMTARQIVNVDALKAASAEFATMRHLAIRFRGLLRGGHGSKIGRLDERRAAIRDLWHESVCQSLAARHRGRAECGAGKVEQWANRGPGQQLKTLKRSMYGRAGVDLLRARLMPLPN
jgi:hypothetical protein